VTVRRAPLRAGLLAAATLALCTVAPEEPVAHAQSLCEALRYTDPLELRVCTECGANFSSACACRISPKFCAGSAKLDVEVQFLKTGVRGAVVGIAGPSGAQTKTTDADGDAIFPVNSDPQKSLKLIIKEITLGPDVVVRGAAFAKPITPWVVKLDREVELKVGESNKKVIVALPSATVFVTALYHDETKDVWVPTRARIVLSLGDKKLISTEVTAQKSSFELLVPPDQTGRELRVEGYDLDHRPAQDLTTLRVPAAGQTVFLNLRLGDLMTQLERARVKVQAMLEQAFGAETARRITTNMRFELGDFPTASYLDGVMRIPRSWSLSNADAAETVFHEWGHRVEEVLASDTTFDNAVGGATSSAWAPARTEWVAWDEARANFYSQLFAASLKYPGDKAYRESAAKSFVGKCASCPGYLAAAVVTHYRDGKQYANALEIARDFQAVHDEARKPGVLGHPPRTYAEFVKAKEALIDRQVRERTLDASKAEARKKSLRDVNTRFKL
jgi:hypothetical protein